MNAVSKFTLNYPDDVQNVIILFRNLVKKGMVVSSLP